MLVNMSMKIAQGDLRHMSCEPCLRTESPILMLYGYCINTVSHHVGDRSSIRMPSFKVTVPYWFGQPIMRLLIAAVQHPTVIGCVDPCTTSCIASRTAVP